MGVVNEARRTLGLQHQQDRQRLEHQDKAVVLQGFPVLPGEDAVPKPLQMPAP